jgi:hypothetical protein
MSFVFAFKWKPTEEERRRFADTRKRRRGLTVG